MEFRLRLLEVPLNSAGSWPLDQDTYLISTMLSVDEVAYGSWLTDLLRSRL